MDNIIFTFEDINQFIGIFIFFENDKKNKVINFEKDEIRAVIVLYLDNNKTVYTHIDKDNSVIFPANVIKIERV